MSYRVRILLLLVFGTALTSCATNPDSTKTEPNTMSGYDADLARELGADDYGMRSYVLVILKTGTAIISDETRRKKLFAGHFSNMASLAEQELLVLAGPFIEGGDRRGLFVFNVATVKEAQELVLTDPAVAAGIFDAEFTRYYGSAALMAVNDIHKKIQKVEIE